MENYSLNLAHIYPDILNSETGTIDVLEFRLKQRGLQLTVNKVALGERIPEADIYFMAGGSEISLDRASESLSGYKEFLSSRHKLGSVIYGLEGGYQLLLDYREYKDGRKTDGLGIIKGYSKETEKRVAGNVVCKINSSLNFGLTMDRLVGFENHNWMIYLQGETLPLAEVIQGQGNNGRDKTEGAVMGSAIGTWLRGPVVANNIEFADYIIKMALNNRYGGEVSLKSLNDDEEKSVYEELLIKPY